MIARVILLRFRPGLSSSSRPGCSHTSTWPFRPRFSPFARPLPFIPPLAALGRPESLLVSHAHTRTPSVRLFCLCRPATESPITYPSRSAGNSGCGEDRRTFPNSRPNAKSSTGKLCDETLSVVSSRRRERGVVEVREEETNGRRRWRRFPLRFRACDTRDYSRNRLLRRRTETRGERGDRRRERSRRDGRKNDVNGSHNRVRSTTWDRGLGIRHCDGDDTRRTR